MILVNDRLQELDLDEAFSRLSQQRRDYLLRFSSDVARRAGAAAYLLLCQGLRQQYGITEPPVFELGSHGKPYLRDYPDVHFSLSHCREAAACAISSRPVGIDVESLRKIPAALLTRTMNEAELAHINSSADAVLAFLELWTRKEAAFKLRGTGIVMSELHTILEDSDALPRSMAPRSRLLFDTCVSHDQRYVYSVCREA